MTETSDLRTLDAQIAVEIFGWTGVITIDDNRLVGRYYDVRGRRNTSDIPRYTTDPRALAKLKSEIVRRGLSWSVQYDATYPPYCYDAVVWVGPLVHDRSPLANYNCSGCVTEGEALARAILANVESSHND